MPFDRACLIGCGVMTGIGAVVRKAKVPAGSSVAVIGCGAVGLNVIQGAVLARRGAIVAIDRDAAKLAVREALWRQPTTLVPPAPMSSRSWRALTAWTRRGLRLRGRRAQIFLPPLGRGRAPGR
jgi:Zn-dependent alcohol dehydrogenase